MAEATQTIEIERSADEVWAVVGDFGGLARWLPSVEEVTVDGDDRTVHTMGIQVVERLRERDDEGRRLVYSVVDGPLEIEHLAALHVSAHEEGGGSTVSWHVRVEPDDLLPVFTDTYAQGLEALRAHLT